MCGKYKGKGRGGGLYKGQKWNASSGRRTDKLLFLRPGKVLQGQIWEEGGDCVVLLMCECVFVYRGSGNLKVKRMVGMLLKKANHSLYFRVRPNTNYRTVEFVTVIVRSVVGTLITRRLIFSIIVFCSFISISHGFVGIIDDLHLLAA